MAYDHGITPKGSTQRRAMRDLYVRTDGKRVSKIAVKLMASFRHWFATDRRFRRFEEREWKS